MKAHTVLSCVLVLVPLTASRGASMNSQDLQNNSRDPASNSTKAVQVSEREQNGLRGPVKACVEERTYPGMRSDDGTQIGELKIWAKTEYDEEGRIAVRRMPQTSRGHGLEGPVWVTRYIYSPAGLLLRIASGKEGEPASETVYRYDDQGRLQSITDSKKPDNPINFRYDENGRKTKVTISRAEDYMPNTGAVSTSADALFEVADRPPNLPGGGSATTIYDANDRPTEIQVRDAEGQIYTRTVRVYDSQGNVVEEKQTMDDPVRMIPAEDRKKMLDGSGMSLDDLRGEFTKFLGPQAEMSSTAYTYDKQGRKSKTIRKIFNHMEDTIETTYNDHGDVDLEVTRSKSATGNEEADKPRYSEAHYSYEYDDHGNWTEKKMAYKSSPEGNSSDEIRRTLEYF
jgi:YD repeat-containing protein